MSGDVRGDARSAILARIRDAQRAAGGHERPAARGTATQDYRRVGSAPRDAVLARFLELLGDYRACSWRVAPAGLRTAIAERCAARGVRRLAVPPDVPAEWLPLDAQVVRDAPGRALDARALDRCDGVLTGCAVAIAQTGTIVLDGGATQGRRALSLVPDYHLCVVRADQVLELVPEALAWIEHAGGTRRPLTLISGPSATSDIELTRVEGVHGPRTLEVLLVASET